MRKILLIGLAFGLTGCATARKKDPIKLAVQCEKSGQGTGYSEDWRDAELASMNWERGKTKSAARMLDDAAFDMLKGKLLTADGMERSGATREAVCGQRLSAERSYRRAAHRKALIAWKGLKRWRSKALDLEDKLDEYRKGCA